MFQPETVERPGEYQRRISIPLWHHVRINMAEKTEYRYQWSNSMQGEIVVVRSDTWEDLLLDIEKARTQFSMTHTPKKTIHAEEEESRCKTCGFPLLAEKRIVSKKSGKAWWVRNCSSGDRDHEAVFRPAE